MDPKEKLIKRKKRHKRIRALIKGTSSRPRLCVFRSNKHIYGQLIDDIKGITLLSASDLQDKIENKEIEIEIDGKEKLTGKKVIAYRVGEILAKKAVNKGIINVIFDRGGYKYHGRVKALAQGARKGGLNF